MTTVQISMRSYLAAGTVAVVGAGAVALAPAVVNTPMPAAPVAVEVSLAANTLSFSDVLGIAGNIGSMLPANITSLIPTDLSGLLAGLGGLLPSSITNLVPANFLNAVVAEFLSEAGGLLGATGTEVLGTLTTAFNGLLVGPSSIPAQFGAALGNIPTVLVTSFSSLTTGNLPAALETLTTGLVAPLTAVAETVTNALQAFQAYVTGVVVNIVSSLPGVLLNSIGTVLGVNLQSALSGAEGALTNLLGGLSSLIPGLPSAAAVPAAAAVSPVVSVSAPRPSAAAALPRAAAVVADPVEAQNDSAQTDSAKPVAVSGDASPRARGARSVQAGAAEASRAPRSAARPSAAVKSERGHAAAAQQQLRLTQRHEVGRCFTHLVQSLWLARAIKARCACSMSLKGCLTPATSW